MDVCTVLAASVWRSLPRELPPRRAEQATRPSELWASNLTSASVDPIMGQIAPLGAELVLGAWSTGVVRTVLVEQREERQLLPAVQRTDGLSSRPKEKKG